MITMKPRKTQTIIYFRRCLLATLLALVLYSVWLYNLSTLTSTRIISGSHPTVDRLQDVHNAQHRLLSVRLDKVNVTILNVNNTVDKVKIKVEKVNITVGRVSLNNTSDFKVKVDKVNGDDHNKEVLESGRATENKSNNSEAKHLEAEHNAGHGSGSSLREYGEVGKEEPRQTGVVGAVAAPQGFARPLWSGGVPSLIREMRSEKSAPASRHTDFAFTSGKPGTCKPKQHLVFLKVHKAASSTVANVIQRYGHSRGLNFVLPKKRYRSGYYNYLSRAGEALNPYSIVPLVPPNVKQLHDGDNTGKENEVKKEYNFLWNHAIYDRYRMDLIMPPGTKYVAILREPFQQFVSALAYYRGINPDNLQEQRVEQQQSLFLKLKAELQMQKLPKRQRTESFNPGSNQFSKYLHLEPHFNAMDYFRNSQSLDLGMSAKHAVLDALGREAYIAKLDRELDLVMITEFFDESLVLLRRLMCWEVKDVLYLPMNSNAEKPHVLFTALDYTRHKQLSQADYHLYDFFRRKFLRTLENQQDDFAQEVQFFRTLLKAVNNYCLRITERETDQTEKVDPVNVEERPTNQEREETNNEQRENTPEVEKNRGSYLGPDSKRGGISFEAKTANNREQEQIPAERNSESGLGYESKRKGVGLAAEKGSSSVNEEEDVLLVPKTLWNEEFIVTIEDCAMMQLPETTFLDVLLIEAWARIGQNIPQ